MNEVPLEPLLLLLAALFLLSAFFTSSETGLMALNRYRLKHLASSGHKGARRANYLLDRPERLRAFMAIGKTVVNTLATAIAVLLGIRVLGNHGAVACAVGLAMAAILLILCEFAPRKFATLHPERLAFPAASIIKPLLRGLWPLLGLVDLLAGRLLRLLGLDTSKRVEEPLSQDELRTLVNDPDEGVPETQQGMLLNILDLEQMTIDDLMVPRNEMVGLDLDDDDETLIRQLHECEFARLPVYKKDIDNIIGILPLRAATRVLEHGKVNRKALMKEVEEPYFVPEGTALHTQLFNFQKKKRRIAIVVDEYGTVQGLVSLEDILEEIVGEFTSNLPAESEDIIEQADGSYIIDGGTAIREINRALDWKLPTDGPKTLSGLLLENLEDFPDGLVGLRIGDYYFETLEVQGNIIRYIKAVCRPEEF